MRRPVWVTLVIAALLLAPFVALLWVPSYTRSEPQLAGFPFFYWYQMAWVPLSSLCTGLAYVLLRRQERRGGASGNGQGSREASR